MRPALLPVLGPEAAPPGRRYPPAPASLHGEEGVPAVAEGDRADEFDSLELVRSLSERFRIAVEDGSGPERRRRRSTPGSPTSVERLVCVRDLVHATTQHVQTLRSAVHPVEARFHIVEPVAGYALWDPDALVDVLHAEIEGLSRATEELFADDRLPEDVRRGLALIIDELVGHTVSQARHQLCQAEPGIGT